MSNEKSRLKLVKTLTSGDKRQNNSEESWFEANERWLRYLVCALMALIFFPVALIQDALPLPEFAQKIPLWLVMLLSVPYFWLAGFFGKRAGTNSGDWMWISSPILIAFTLAHIVLGAFGFLPWQW